MFYRQVKESLYTDDILITHLLSSRTFRKQLLSLKKSGKKGTLAAAQCSRILHTIRVKGCITKTISSKRTKNGECRIENCIKYNLGNGYRLVTILQNGHLYIPFIGSHDDADLWIDRHRCDAFTPTDNSFISEKIDLQSSTKNEREMEEKGTPEPDLYEEYLQSRLEASLLKSIFQGLHR